MTTISVRWLPLSVYKFSLFLTVKVATSPAFFKDHYVEGEIVVGEGRGVAPQHEDLGPGLRIRPDLCWADPEF